MAAHGANTLLCMRTSPSLNVNYDGQTEMSTANNTYFVSLTLAPITVVIGTIIHGVIVLEWSYYSGSGWSNDDRFFYICGCCN